MARKVSEFPTKQFDTEGEANAYADEMNGKMKPDDKGEMPVQFKVYKCKHANLTFYVAARTPSAVSVEAMSRVGVVIERTNFAPVLPVDKYLERIDDSKLDEVIKLAKDRKAQRKQATAA